MRAYLATYNDYDEYDNEPVGVLLTHEVVVDEDDLLDEIEGFLHEYKNMSGQGVNYFLLNDDDLGGEYRDPKEDVTDDTANNHAVKIDSLSEFNKEFIKILDQYSDKIQTWGYESTEDMAHPLVEDSRVKKVMDAMTDRANGVINELASYDYYTVPTVSYKKDLGWSHIRSDAILLPAQSLQLRKTFLKDKNTARLVKVEDVPQVDYSEHIMVLPPFAQKEHMKFYALLTMDGKKYYMYGSDIESINLALNVFISQKANSKVSFLKNWNDAVGE